MSNVQPPKESSQIVFSPDSFGKRSTSDFRFNSFVLKKSYTFKVNFPTATLRRHIALTSAYINLKSYPSEKQNATVRPPNSTLQHICVGPENGW